jgi:hypothetical protein
MKNNHLGQKIFEKRNASSKSRKKHENFEGKTNIIGLHARNSSSSDITKILNFEGEVFVILSSK